MYSPYAGHRGLTAEVFCSEPVGEDVLATGVQDIKGSVSLSDQKGLIGSWGTDWQVNDTVKNAKETVGLANYVPQKYVVKEAKDKPNYLYLVSNKGGDYIKYYTSFTSMKETFGYKTPEAWFEHIQAWKDELEQPFIVKVLSK